jgi:hypothetical protein
MKDSAQVTAPGAIISMIAAVSTRPNKQNRSTCSRISPSIALALQLLCEPAHARWFLERSATHPLMADLVRRRVAVIATAGDPPTLVAKAAIGHLASVETRSGIGWSPAWPVRAATRQASIFFASGRYHLRRIPVSVRD